MVFKMTELNILIDLIRTENYNTALEYSSKIKKKFLKNDAYWDILGVLYKNQGEYSSSKKSFQRSLKINKYRVSAYNNLGNLYSEQNKALLAISEYKKALKIDSNYHDARKNLILELLKQEQLENIEKIFPDTSIDNFDIDFKLLYAEYLLKIKQYSRSIELYKNILLLEPNNIKALHNIGLNYYSLGNYQHALLYYKKALNINFNIAELHHNMATCYADIGDIESANHHYNYSIKLEPYNLDYHHWKSLFSWKIGDTSTFLDNYKQVVKHSLHADILAKFTLEVADKLQMANSNQDAVNEYRKVIENKLYSAFALKGLSISLLELEEFDESLFYARKAYKSNTNNILDLIMVLIANDSLNEAEKLMQSSYKKYKNNQRYWALKSTLLRMQNNDDYHKLVNYKDLLLMEKLEAPVGYDSIEHFNVELLGCLLQEHKYGAPLEQSLLNGSQTINDLYQKDNKLIQLFKQKVFESEKIFFSNIDYDCYEQIPRSISKNHNYNGTWSVALKSEGFHVSHYHSKGVYSGPYYVNIPNEVAAKEKNGWLKLGEPGFKTVKKLEADMYICPYVGLLIRFPSYFWHSTTPFQSDDLRVTITSDIIG